MTVLRRVGPAVAAMACVGPTAYGLRDDGLLPPSATTEITGHLGLGRMAATFGGEPPFAGGAGLQGRWPLSEGLGLRVNGSLFRGDDTSAVSVEVDALIAALAEPSDALTLTFSAGPSLFASTATDSALWGLQGGATVSRSVAGGLHPYLGVRLNPVFTRVDPVVRVWAQAGGGLSWRPPLRHGALALGLEGGRYQSWNGCDAVSWSVYELRWHPYNCGSWAVGLYAGLTLPHHR